MPNHLRGTGLMRAHQPLFFQGFKNFRRPAAPDFQTALQQRRQLIVGDCRQLKIDTDSYNENWNDAEPIQMSLDFSADVEELELVGA